jgi:hypothetical protein
MQDTHLEKLIHEMLTRQNKLMIDLILPELERLRRLTNAHNNELQKVHVAVKELSDEYFERVKRKPQSDVRTD